jgi:uncharacterized protein (AIM24 family)
MEQQNMNLKKEATVLGADESIKDSEGKVEFVVSGSTDFPLITCHLQPGQSVLAEPGRMIQMPEGIHFETVAGDGTAVGFFGKIAKGVSAMFSGESIMNAKFTNQTEELATMKFGTVIPGGVVGVNLDDYENELVCGSGSFYAGASGIQLKMCFKQSLGTAFFGGESLILQSITGRGPVLFRGGGYIMCEELNASRPSIRVDSGCLVAWTKNLKYSFAMAGGLKSMIFGGEGLFHATITLESGESGKVWIESFPYSKMISIIKTMYSH